ncbi:MAG: hypothetical protein HOP16_02355 [Acidobacteria bacterium]|nr:hypothetical protein [Acidobacteriota bacterium]
MRAKSTSALLAGVVCFAVVAAGCGDIARQDRSPVMLVIEFLGGASGATGGSTFGGTLQSDVVTLKDGNATVFSDAGQVRMRFTMKDTLTTPSALNAVTINRYRVTYRRSDGFNTPGVDVPYPFDSAMTFTIAPGGVVTQGFELIRHIAKQEAPLMALRANPVVISTVADVTFFGRDQAGNELSVTGSMGVQFGNFADPD